MADFRSKLTLDGSDFGKAIDDAQKQVNSFAKSTSDASKQVDDMGKATKKTASELLNEMKSMEGLGRSTSNYRSQLAQMTRQIQDLSINYNQMTTEMKNSDFGREVAAQIQELTSKAADMRDQVQDAAAAVKLLASDTKNLDAAKSAIEGLSAGMQLFASAGILGEKNTEKVVKALAKLKAVESSTNAVIKIANILNKDSILLLKIKEIQTKAAVKAQAEYTAAAGTATAAQRAFNIVAKANPYVLLAAAIFGVVGALAAFSRGADDAADAQDGLNAEIKKGAELNKSYKDTFNNTYVPLITAFKTLQTGWKKLRTDLEKTEFIKKNADEFKKLGVEVNSVTDAENILVKNSGLFIKTLDLRAQAAAAAAVAMDAYKEAMSIDMKGFDRLPQAGDLVPKNVQNPRRYGLAWDHMEDDGMHNDYKFTQEGADLYIIENKLATAYISKTKAIDKANDALQRQVDIQQQLAAIMPQFASQSAPARSSSTAEPHKKLETIELPDRQAEYIVPAKVKVEEVWFPEASMQAFNDTISDAISGFKSLDSAVSTVGKSVSDLAEGWDESKSAVENITTKVGDMLAIMQTICSVMDTMNKLSAIFETLQELIWKHKQNQNAEEAAGLALKGASAALASEEATANIAGAAGGIAESASKIPYVGWAIALAAIASFIGMIASLPKFAQGGIVPGNSFSGDHITAQLNSGEMVLNTSQQRHLFGILDGSASIASGQSKVEFVIKGQELKGVLRNYDKKMSRI